VRGEDSFVRAQWAARPLIWQAYVQREQTHRVKVSAFVDRYLARAATDHLDALRTFIELWNDDARAGDASSTQRAWLELEPVLPHLQAHARRWSRTLETLPELAAHLVGMARQMV
jgi:hypothetical protein